MEKIKVYHFHNGGGGGVLSVIKNLIKFSNNSNIENHIIYAVNKSLISNYVIEFIEGALTQQIFYYTDKNNFYHTSKQLSALLPNNNAVIVAHDWLELGMVSNLGLQNPVIQILHGNYNYYYELAQKNEGAINSFICISPTISKTLKNILKDRNKDIFHINFPVPFVEKKVQLNKSLRIIYYVSDLRDHNKQFNIIIEIAKKLSIEKTNFFFTIAGGGYSKETFYKIWPISMVNNVNYFQVISNENILKLLPLQDIFLLPSTFEGLPVSLVESMKAGLVPLVTDWDGAVNELVINGFSGYYFKAGDVDGYVNTILNLNQNRDLLKRLSDNSSIKGNYFFNPFENTIKFETIFQIYSKQNYKKNKNKIYGSRLDQVWLPNKVTKFLRKII